MKSSFFQSINKIDTVTKITKKLKRQITIITEDSRDPKY